MKVSLMTPIAGQLANAAEARYNRSLKRTRVTVEQTIGIWKQRFKCVHKKGGELCYTPEKCGKIVAAILLLHSYCRQRRIPLLEEVEAEEEVDDDDPVPADGGRNALVIAGHAKRRQVIAEYFS